MSDALHPAAPHHLPAFMTAPGETDWLMVGTGVFLIIVVLMVGNLFLRLHTLPERLAHKSQKLQFEIVAVLGLLALFTHVHAFWVAGLLLPLCALPDFGTPPRRTCPLSERRAGGSAGRPRSLPAFRRTMLPPARSRSDTRRITPSPLRTARAP